VQDLGVVNAVLARKDCWPKGKKTAHAAPFARIFDEAEFFDSLRDPGALEKDWEWNAGPLLVLLKFAQQFSARYECAKRARGAVDFHDLEQGALRLLWGTDGPSAIARRWQQRLEAVFVDEYQDINAAQDLIISAVSREGAAGNRFLVGDIKQSIYRFRQADPTIFRRYLGAQQGWTRAIRVAAVNPAAMSAPLCRAISRPYAGEQREPSHPRQRHGITWLAGTRNHSDVKPKAQFPSQPTCFSIGLMAMRRPVAASTAVRLRNSGLPDFESILYVARALGSLCEPPRQRHPGPARPAATQA